MPVPRTFPRIKLKYEGPDANPAIQLFGRRFFSDQSPLEYLTELLLVMHSTKRIGSEGKEFNTILPDWETLHEWSDGYLLNYRAPIRLNLKLFSFLGASKLDTRHDSHKKQYDLILRKLRDIMRTDGSIDKREIVEALGNLFLGFQGAGFNRTWCAQTFLPISSNFLIQETLWNETIARREGQMTWLDSLSQFKKFYSVAKHRFMARGGELLYLQLCNAFRTDENEFHKFVSTLDFTEEEQDLKTLHSALEKNLSQITNQSPAMLNHIATLIDAIDEKTTQQLEAKNEFSECAWCPEESWQEGYLFAVELNRLCQAAIDPIERIELLIVGCALHVLRCLSAQSIRFSKTDEHIKSYGGSLKFAWIVTSPRERARGAKILSQRNLQINQRVIQQALRHEEIYKNANCHAKNKRDTLYNEADNRYGHKLFLSLAKKIGLVIPQRGPGARFVLNDKILRYLVLTLVRPGERRTLEDFKESLYTHYGIAIEGDQLLHAMKWSEFPIIESTKLESTHWLETILQASGFLIHLSDAFSLVQNPFKIET